jgi:hypothetical protein
MKSVPYHPYSLDLAPPDFYLFGDVKRYLTGLSFQDADQFLVAVEGVPVGIESDLASGLSRVDGPIKKTYRYR